MFTRCSRTTARAFRVMTREAPAHEVTKLVNKFVESKNKTIKFTLSHTSQSSVFG